jgi:hypothetical protein
MSHIPQSPLAEQAAALRASVLATEAPCWLPESAHALILSLLVRIIARLEDMIALWTQGLLPPPLPPRAIGAHPRTRSPSRSGRRTPRPYSRRAHRTPELRPRAPRIRIWWSRHCGARTTFALPRPRPRPPRDPPRAQCA